MGKHHIGRGTSCEILWRGDIIREPEIANAASANIIPDPSGISYYDSARFVEVIRTRQGGARKLSPQTPWANYRNITEAALKAIFPTCKRNPVKHRVDNTEPATFCKLCRDKHAAGDQN